MSLRGNRIRALGARYLFGAVAGHRALTRLDVSGNEIGASYRDNAWVPSPEGPAAIAGAIRANDVLTSLDLSMNRLGAAGAERVGEAVQANVSECARRVEGPRAKPTLALRSDRRNVSSARRRACWRR